MKITLNNLDDVFKSKLMSIETMELKGFELIDNLFVDSSGFGSDSEPALTVDSFRSQLTRIVKEHGAVYSTITNQGMFQVYVGLFKKTGATKMTKIGNNTYRVTLSDGYAIRLHDTDILTYRGNKVTLNNGGWYSKTTKERLNMWLPFGVTIQQRDFSWYVVDTRDNTEVPYSNGLTIEA